MDAKTKAALKATLIKYQASKAEAQKAAEKAAIQHLNLIERMQDAGVTKFNVELEDGEVTGTLVEGSTVSVDLAALKDAVKPSIFDRVTKRSIDMTAFRNAIASGDVDVDVANDITTETPRSPFVRVTKK